MDTELTSPVIEKYKSKDVVSSLFRSDRFPITDGLANDRSKLKLIVHVFAWTIDHLPFLTFWCCLQVFPVVTARSMYWSARHLDAGTTSRISCTQLVHAKPESTS